MSARHSVKGDILPRKKSCLNQLLGFDRVAQQFSLLQAWNRWKKNRPSIYLSSWNSHLKYDCPVQTKPANRKAWHTMSSCFDRSFEPSNPARSTQMTPQGAKSHQQLHKIPRSCGSKVFGVEKLDLNKDWTCVFWFFLDGCYFRTSQIAERICDPLFWLLWTCLG